MQVRDIAHGASILSGRIETEGGERFELEYRFEGVELGALACAGDPFLAALLTPAMALGEELEISAPVSPRLLAAAAAIQDICAAWGVGSRVAIRATPAEATSPPGGGVGQMFSGGVDSYYSLFKGEAKTHLVFVHGFDIPLADAASFATAAEPMLHTAREVGSVPVLVRTNLREFSEPLVPWEMYHGGALASVALALQGLVRQVVIPSSWAYANLRPYGSHPLLDPLWSTESLEIVHDGCEARRFEKVAAIADSDLALASLRVCFAPDANGGNCGRCEKCVATQAFLLAAGALDRTPTFPPGFGPETLRRMDIRTPAGVQTLADLLASLRERGDRGELADAVEQALR
jgi:hypothetical protein